MIRYALPVLLLTVSLVSGQTRLLRYPDIEGDTVVFSYAGDLWKVPDDGGTARRLTAHPGLELFPKISPDGEWVAFTGQYDGDEQVYVMPINGGSPKQLTYYPARGPLADRWGYDNQVHGWTGDSERVVFRSTREFWGPKDGRLYTVSIDGGLPVALPMPISGAGDLSADGQQIVYSPLFRDFRAWKRYEGGWAQDLYLFYVSTRETLQITDHARTERDPMWVGDSIFFASDRDDRLNLYRFDPATRQTTQVTDNTTWDVRWPSSDGESRIVYELNGELWVYDANSDRSTALAIDVPDDGLHNRPRHVAVADYLEEYSLSPKGERALFVARGDVFTAPIEQGPTRNLTNSSDAHERRAAWSPDGSRIVYISDRRGEEELYLINQDGSGEPVQLTSNGEGMRYDCVWSPDSRKIAFSDKEGRLFVIDVESREMVEVANEPREQMETYSWSPDSRWLAYSMTATERTRSIHIWSVEDRQDRTITSSMFDCFEPVWDTEGKYLFYLSDRTYAPQISGLEWDFAGDRMTGIFALALRKDVPDLFPAKSDEVTPEAEEEEEEPEGTPEEGEGDDAEEEETADEETLVEIDFDGLAGRVMRVPVEADNYEGLSAKEGYLLYLRGPASYYGRPADFRPELRIFSLEDREAETLVADVSGYDLSDDGEKVLVRSEGGFALYDAAFGAGDSKKDVSTSGLEADIDPKTEYSTIFNEVWRRYRDFFYVENMHGYDWPALRDQYEPWLDYVAHRADLNYVIAEMISELSVGHAYIAGGNWERPPRPRVALPGAEFELDEETGRYRIGKILAGQNEEENYRSPLTEVGVDASEGDYVLAIDGEELRAEDNPYRLLRYKADRPVALTVNSTPSFDGSRVIRYDPITDESDLRYLTWITNNRRRVDEATGGRVGYMHLPDMSNAGIREFIKHFYPQIRKEGMVIDVRGNGGGNVSQMILNRLVRPLLGTRFERTGDFALTYPQTVYYGHLVCLISENSASDGDIFPARFREAGLGPLIGKRSWGGVVGYTGRGPLLDGGTVNVPEFGTNDVNGDWVIEGHGVDPDIEVEFPPEAALEGRDPQLERGIEELMRQIEEDPRGLPERPAPPVKTP